MDYVKFAESIRPLYLLNDWKLARPGSGTMEYPSVERLAEIARWAHGCCIDSERDETYASTGRIRVEKFKASESGEYRYRFLIDVHLD